MLFCGVLCCGVQVGILQKMQPCRNTVRLLGCYETNDEVMVVTQLCSGGDLQKLSDVSVGASRELSRSNIQPASHFGSCSRHSGCGDLGLHVQL